MYSQLGDYRAAHVQPTEGLQSCSVLMYSKLRDYTELLMYSKLGDYRAAHVQPAEGLQSCSCTAAGGLQSCSCTAAGGLQSGSFTAMQLGDDAGK